jgi:hypothetical protein
MEADRSIRSRPTRLAVEALAMRLKMPNLIEVLVMVAIVAVLVAILQPGSDFDTTPRYPSSAVAGVDLSRVAGDYYQGNGRRNWFLSVLPDGRYSFVSKGCVGILLREPGHATEVDGHIVLTPEKANDSKYPRKWLPIRWGERTYLLWPDELPRFCEAILDGSEPRNELHGNNYLNNLGRADGLPELPEEWLAKMRARLTTGKILEASEEGSWAKVALGRRQGVKVGDRLRLQGFPHLQLRVKAVADDSCLVEALDIGDKNDMLKLGRNVIIPRP